MKTALIIGGSSGLGLASAHSLIKNEISVRIVGRNEQSLLRAKNTLSKGCLETISLDMTIDSQIEKFCSSNANYPDVLILNAGGPPPGPAFKMDRLELEKSLQAHLYSNMRLADWALPRMIEKGFGRIVAITSITAKSPVENMAVSNTVRGAVQNWLKTLSREVAARGVTVNCALPGYTRTDRVEDLFNEQANRTGKSRQEIESKILSQIPMARLGEPREFGDLVSFLCSDGASFITGQAIAVDGGWTQGI